MAVYTFNPLEDRRWSEFVRQHPRGSVFHSVDWLEALRRTYRFEPIVWTTSSPHGALTNGLVFCRVSSWLSPSRLVALPFADHCEPLVDCPEDLAAIGEAVRQTVAGRVWTFAEVRARRSNSAAFLAARTFQSYCLHLLDLRPSQQDLFQRLHKDCIQRKIRRAEREGLTIERGRSDAVLAKFYQLLVLTRRRHGLPPQSMAWFRNLVDCFDDRLTIHLALHNGRPLGGLLTLRHRQSLVYKYGVSDARFHRCGTMPFLFWSLIRQAKADGIEEIDLGRSDARDAGLIAFKDRLGAKRSAVAHLRLGESNRQSVRDSALARRAGALLACVPDRVFVFAGQLFYRHLG